jgi:CheY-like chemotaxis protein
VPQLFQIREREPTPDLVLMDIQLSVLDGYETMSRIKALSLKGRRRPLLRSAHSP